MESESNKLFVGGITHSTNTENLREYFSKYGEVKNAQVMRNRATGVSRGFGFVSFADQSSMEKALQNEEHEILGRRVAVNIPRPIEKKPLQLEVSVNDSNQNSSPSKTNKVFVGGLPPSLTKEEFDGYFESFGKIVDSVIMCNKENNKPRGFGFVIYDSEESVQKVVIDRFHQLKNKWVDVKRAIPRGEALITFHGHDSYLASWGYAPYSIYQRPSPNIGGYCYDAYARMAGTSNSGYYGPQVWVNALYPSYRYNTPLGQLGNSYVDPKYEGANGNGRWRDDGPSPSSNTAGNGNGIAKSATIQETEVVENGVSEKPNDEISKVVVHAECSLCGGPKAIDNGISEMAKSEDSKVIVNGNGVVNGHGTPKTL
ncbi:uncharacterized protein LOC142537870 [Primulina tabacum]|uniref:uncharacterized protein LOC142537870 n=1 Tax=Primulina tabacum TaxID=48773 RepID=UPI003F5A2B49